LAQVQQLGQHFCQPERNGNGNDYFAPQQTMHISQHHNNRPDDNDGTSSPAWEVLGKNFHNAGRFFILDFLGLFSH